jgi:hypothetical protein
MTSNQLEKQFCEGPKELLTPEQLSLRLAVPIATLAFWRATNQGPRFLKIGRHVRYDTKDVNYWLLSLRGGSDA